MDIITRVAKHIFDPGRKALRQMELHPEEIQTQQLVSLIRRARNTLWGRMHDYANIRTYSSYAAKVPLQTYEDVKPYILRMMQGEYNLIWHEKIHWFAQSSGTTSDKSKYIPVGKTSLRECHYRGAKDVLTAYFDNVPDSKFFSGKGLVLGGTRKPTVYNKNIFMGDLSAVLISNINPLANMFRVPSKEIILMDEWEKKLNLICQAVVRENVTNISGVPSWFLVLLNRLLEQTKKADISEIWPNLEVFIHGGVSFAPYQEQYKRYISSSRMKYMETYNASEGFFALQNDLSDPTMMLLLDYGVFYEFIPIEDSNSDNPTIIPLSGVKTGVNYALVVSTNNGLWRYKIGDTIKFTSTKPYKIVITGRTQFYINTFGEEVIVDNAEKALSAACKQTHAQVREYTVAPVYMFDKSKGKHQWLIEFIKPPQSIDDFRQTLDLTLQSLNSDYEAKRYKSMTLEMPEVIIAPQNLFYDWLKTRGKLGGQNKIPRLSNTREHIDALLQMMEFVG